MAKDKPQQGEQQLHKNKVDQNTVHLEDKDIERMPDSDDDYRLPRQLPEEGRQEDSDDTDTGGGENDDLIDEDTDISSTELALLEEAERETSSDESRASDLLDDTDEDGVELNEGPDEDNAFDLGEDLDMPNNVSNPDIDADEEDD